jgi:metal-responsive CopG/Arc/MetJ family transcriptional regulator
MARPKTTGDRFTLVGITLPNEYIEEIDEVKNSFEFGKDISRSAFIRRLIEAGLEFYRTSDNAEKSEFEYDDVKQPDEKKRKGKRKRNEKLVTH